MSKRLLVVDDSDASFHHTYHNKPISKYESRYAQADAEGTQIKFVVPSMILVHFSLIVVQVLFGAGSVVGKLGLQAGMNPVLFGLLREACAAPLLCIFAFIVDRRIPKLQHWWYFILPGVALYGNQILFLIGLKLGSPVVASAWQPSQPLMAAVIAALMGMETLRFLKVVGIFLGVGGAVFMVVYGATIESTGSVGQQIGSNACFFGNCLCTVMFVVWAKRPLQEYSSPTVLCCAYVTASVLMLISAVTINLIPDAVHFICQDCHGPWSIPLTAVYALIYWVLVTSIFCYLLMTWANRYAPATIVMIYSVLQPLAATLLSLLLIGVGVAKECSTSKSSLSRLIYSTVIPTSIPSSTPTLTIHPTTDDSCLNGLSISDLGAIGIVAGLIVVVYSDYKQKQNEAKEDEERALVRNELQRDVYA